MQISPLIPYLREERKGIFLLATPLFALTFFICEFLNCFLSLSWTSPTFIKPNHRTRPELFSCSLSSCCKFPTWVSVFPPLFSCSGWKNSSQTGSVSETIVHLHINEIRNDPPHHPHVEHTVRDGEFSNSCNWHESASEVSLSWHRCGEFLWNVLCGCSFIAIWICLCVLLRLSVCPCHRPHHV